MQRLPLIFLCLISGLCFYIHMYIHLGRPQSKGKGKMKFADTVKKTALEGGGGQKLHKICGHP